RAAAAPVREDADDGPRPQLPRPDARGGRVRRHARPRAKEVAATLPRLPGGKPSSWGPAGLPWSVPVRELRWSGLQGTLYQGALPWERAVPTPRHQRWNRLPSNLSPDVEVHRRAEKGRVDGDEIEDGGRAAAGP